VHDERLSDIFALGVRLALSSSVSQGSQTDSLECRSRSTRSSSAGRCVHPFFHELEPILTNSLSPAAVREV